MSAAPSLRVVTDDDRIELLPRSGKIAIADVVIGERARKDLGDISALVTSIRDEVGALMQPIVLGPGNQLVAGFRRLEACKRIGWTEIDFVRPLTRDDAVTLLKAERDENECRKPMTTTELVAMGSRIEDLERPKAQARQGARTDLTSGSTDPEVEYAKTNDVVAEALGISPSTYKRAKTVVNATEDADPAVADVAREQLAKLDAGETSYTAADQAVRDARNGKKEAIDFNDPLVDAEVPEPEVIPGLPTKVKGPRQNHLKMLTRIVVGLSGTAMALDGIEEVNDTVNAEEARRLMSDLSPSIRSLNRINKLLKERTK